MSNVTINANENLLVAIKDQSDKMKRAAGNLLHLCWLAEMRIEDNINETAVRHLKTRIKHNMETALMLFSEEDLDELIEEEESLRGFAREWRDWIGISQQ